MPTADFDVFLSYHWRDHAEVEQLARRLREQQLTVFLDRWYLTPGQSWPSALETTLAHCRAVAVCIGQGEMGPWQQRELYLALERQVAAERTSGSYPVIPVLLPGSEPPLGFLSQHTWVDFRDRAADPLLLTTLVRAIRGQSPGPDAQETIGKTFAAICPYRGLLYFREEDAPFFFGRATAVTHLIHAVSQHSLVAVVGASGSGKSSVVRAGLVPALRPSHAPVWEVATFVPTDRPFQAMAAALMPWLEPDLRETDRLIETTKLADALRHRHTVLRDVADSVLKKQLGTDRLLLVVDQWEELCTLCQDEPARRAFIDQVLDATAATKLSVVLTLRGDFYDRAITTYRPLSDRVQGALVNLGPMTQEELRLAIEEPARQVGLSFEPGLVELILEQAGDEPGHLPLVEFVLRQLWAHRRGGQLHHEAYKAMGQLEGAIANKAESLYVNLSEADQRKLQQIFLRLVRPGEGEADTRRRATLVEVGEDVGALAKRLADERLLVTSRLAGSAEDSLEVSHEALIRHWDRLKRWVDADRRFLAWHERLRAAVEQYQESQKSEDALLRGFALTEARDWLEQKPEYFSALERHFIAASQRCKVRRHVVAAATVGLVLLLVGGPFAWMSKEGLTPEDAVLTAQSHFMSIAIVPEVQRIESGTFLQGDSHGLGIKDEQPLREVRIKRFAIGKHEVTFDEYKRFALATKRPLPHDEYWGHGRRPVINVSWEDAKAYAKWLSQETDQRYRLPTESEWEYAARSIAINKDEIWAGTSEEAQLKEYVVYEAKNTEPVGSKKANGLDLYDMSGNVWEWVEDCWHENYRGAPTDGSPWLQSEGGGCRLRVIRGGAWNVTPQGPCVRHSGSGAPPAIGMRTWASVLSRT